MNLFFEEDMGLHMQKKVSKPVGRILVVVMLYVYYLYSAFSQFSILLVTETDSSVVALWENEEETDPLVL